MRTPTLFPMGDSHKLARVTDPRTSKRAARKVEEEARSQRVQIYEALLALGEGTPGEIGVRMGKRAHPNLIPCKRLKGMEEDGLVERRPARVCRVMGNPATVWRVREN